MPAEQSLMNVELPDFLLREEHGGVRIQNHRIDLYHVIEAYNDGLSAEMIAVEYPTLSLSIIHKVIAFYLDHRSEVDAYVRKLEAGAQRQVDEFDRKRRSPTLAELRQRLDKRRSAGAA